MIEDYVELLQLAPSHVGELGNILISLTNERQSEVSLQRVILLLAFGQKVSQTLRFSLRNTA